jgi:gas vesicle protein
MRFLLGLGVGYLVGLLFAPAAGQETRTRIIQQVDSGAREKAREIGARAGEIAYEEVKKSVS